VLIAIWLSIWHDVRNHKGLALRAVVLQSNTCSCICGRPKGPICRSLQR
jgi:hypothetical protein